MSQLQVTGEAKIRDIQGPVVANSGVITALDGAANQYVRGDGTLAIFPSSSGGGSSVSYYLNGSVNQGTFGGSTYYQMSRNAIVGTGTNFSTSSDGLIAQFITDANDPDVVSIPSGNWNVEFFMNVSASSGALASFYVEIYKYNGSTFTLLATNVATPEQLTNTTTVDAYFTSVAMPLSAMAVTDRLAIRIFANVASKTVTLYTEDNRLCQIVTTFSNGLTSLNNLTDQSQYLTTGTSGTDFNIVSSGDTHTFNIPSASASNRGLITTGSQTIAGIKTLSVPSQFEQGLYLKQNMNLFQAGYIGLGASTTGLIVGLSGGGFGTLNFNNTTSFTYTFPDASGTVALTSNLSSYVPYTGATGDVNLGLFSIISNRVSAIGDNSTYGGTLSIKQNNVRSLLGTGYTELFGKTNILGVSFGVGSIANLSNSVLTAERTFTLPDLSGTFALLEGTQTFSGSKTFSTGIKAESGIFLKELSSSGRLTGYVGISATATGGMQQIQFLYPVSGSSVFSLPTTGAYNYEFPIVSGTIALTSDLGSYVTIGTTQTITGAKTFTQNLALDGNASNAGTLLLKSNSALPTAIGYTGINSTNNSIYLTTFVSNPKTAALDLSGLSDNIIRTFTFPNASGTIALTSNLSSYVPYTGATTNVDLGARNLSSYAVNVNGDGTSGGALNLKMYNSLTLAGVGYLSIYAQTDYYFGLAWNFVSGTKQAIFNNVLIPINNTRYYNLPNADGTLALTSDLSAYLPLTGGTLTGALTGTSAEFSGNNHSLASNNTLRFTDTDTATEANQQIGKIEFYSSDTSTPGAGVKAYIGAFAQDTTPDAYLSFATQDGSATPNPVERLRISSEGLATFSNNIAIAGQTLSAWGGNFGVMQSYYGSYFGGTTGGGTVMGNNNYYDGTNYKYINSDFAGQIQIGGGNILLRVAPSGTAGNNVTYTNALTIASTGAATFSSSAIQLLTLASTASNGSYLAFTNSGTLNGAIGNGSNIISGLSNSDLGIWTTGIMAFQTNGSERMRITSGGSVFINTTSANITSNMKLSVKQTLSEGAAEVWTSWSGDQGTAAFWVIKYDNVNTTSQIFQRFAINNGGTACGQINANGASQVAFGSYSDIRLKENIAELEPQLDKILALKPCEFDYKDGSGHQIGFIAQEMQQVYPDVVNESLDGMLTLSGWNKTEARLVKAIQEQTQIIKNLEARIKQLENK